MPFGKVTLNDDNEIPAIAFGTGSALFGRDATDAVGQALEQGFDHIDTAAIYGNESSVGAAIVESGLARSDVYVTTKYGGGPIGWSFVQSLARLRLKSVDLYLIHSPTFIAKFGLEHAWREFEQIKSSGKAKSIGVSNFTLENLQDLVKIAKVKPAVNQACRILLFASHPYNYTENKALLEFSAEHGIVTAAYSSLTPITKLPGGPVDKPVADAARRIGATPAQVILLWVRSKGVVIVTSDELEEIPLQEYLAVGDLPSLTDDEIAAIDAAGAKGPGVMRQCSVKSLSTLAFKILAYCAMFAFAAYVMINADKLVGDVQ